MVIYKTRKIPTKQKNLEGEIIMKTEYITEDEAPEGVSAGKLTAEGVTFDLIALKEHEGSYKNKNTGEIRPFYTAEGTQTLDGQTKDFALVFGSAKLARVMGKVVRECIITPEKQSVRINVSGYGEGFDRNYKVRIVE
jgi:hypothetical protein